MSDANVDLGGSNLFSLGASFHAQSSSTEEFSTEELALSAIGNKACTNVHNLGTNYTATYLYCGTDLATDLGTIVTTFGAVVNGILPTGLDLSFSVGAQAEVTLTGHNHAVNAHDGTNPPNTFDVSGLIPASSGLGVPNFITVAGETASPATASRSAATLSIAVNHIDAEGNAGHFVGESITCRADLSVDYEGVAGAETAGSWLQILQTTNDGNGATDTSNVTAHQFIDAI